MEPFLWIPEGAAMDKFEVSSLPIDFGLFSEHAPVLLVLVLAEALGSTHKEPGAKWS